MPTRIKRDFALLLMGALATAGVGAGFGVELPENRPTVEWHHFFEVPSDPRAFDNEFLQLGIQVEQQAKKHRGDRMFLVVELVKGGPVRTKDAAGPGRW